MHAVRTARMEQAEEEKKEVEEKEVEEKKEVEAEVEAEAEVGWPHLPPRLHLPVQLVAVRAVLQTSTASSGCAAQSHISCGDGRLGWWGAWCRTTQSVRRVSLCCFGNGAWPRCLWGGGPSPSALRATRRRSDSKEVEVEVKLEVVEVVEVVEVGWVGGGGDGWVVVVVVVGEYLVNID